MSLDSLLECFKSSLKASAISVLSCKNNEYKLVKLITTQESLPSYTIFEGKVDSLTPFYAEGYQMLSQTCGTFLNPISIGRCPDDEPPYCQNPNPNFKNCYNYCLFFEDNKWYLLGFTSSNHYIGVFYLYPNGKIKIDMDLACAKLKVGELLEFESFTILEGDSKQELLDKFAALINSHHKPLQFKSNPNGWCSWYYYYENISSKAIKDNLELLKDHKALEYIQIDDGYQTHMGDWLCFTDKFEGGLKAIVDDIHKEGKKAALWVAPFIVSGNSKVFKEHSDFLLKDSFGNLVSSDNLTYGGWRDTPWYALDFSNPKVLDYITKVFHYFSHDLHIKYFKLDACYWGAIRSYCYNRNFSCVDNYRKGLEIILKAVGKDAFILGCNAPLWPSLGLVHGMRVSDDIVREHHRIKQIAFEVFNRQWMNKKLWINDPDCLCLKNLKDQVASTEDYKVHLATILISDGVLMLGDAIHTLEDTDLEKINKILEVKAWDKEISYRDDFSYFKIQNKKTHEVIEVYFNFSDKELALSFAKPCKEFWCGESIEGKYTVSSNSALCIIS